MRQRLTQGLERLRLAQMPQKTQDQSMGDPELPLTLDESRIDAVDHSVQRNSTGRMGLRIEEDLHVYDALIVRFAQIGCRQLAEVIFCLQHLCTCVVDIQEGLQIGEA